MKHWICALLIFQSLLMPAMAEDTTDSLHDLLSTPKMPYKMEQAFQYLFDLKGFSTKKMTQTYEALSEHKPIQFTLLGGPTGEGIVYRIKSLEELVALENKVKSQQHRDTFRPDLKQVKSIVIQRGFLIKSKLKRYQSSLKKKRIQAQNKEPALETHLTQLQSDISQLQQILESAYQSFTHINIHYLKVKKDHDQWEGYYSKLKDAYNTLKNKYNKNYKSQSTAVKKAAYYWDQSKRAETLIFKDPKNSAAHRKNALYYRKLSNQWHQRAESLKQWLNQTYPEVQSRKNKMDEAKPELDKRYQALTRIEADRNQKQRHYKELSNRNARLNQDQSDTFEQLQKLKTKINVLKSLESKRYALTLSVAKFEKSIKSLSNYTEFKGKKPAVYKAFKSIATLATNGAFEAQFGPGIKKELGPLLTLLKNMEKPPLA